MLPITSTNLVTYIFKLLSNFINTVMVVYTRRTRFVLRQQFRTKNEPRFRAVYALQLNDTAEEARHGSSIHRTTIIDSCEHETSSAN